MYGKIFQAIYDGTLADNWQALVTFEQMIVLCDADGILDMTPQALHRRTGIPVEIFIEGIRFLEAPDRRSKSPAQAGRRIIRLDEHRDWGWQLVNHTYYRDLVDADTVREQNRARQQRWRERQKEDPPQPDLLGDLLEENRNGPSRSVTGNNAESRHTDTDTDTEEDTCPADRIFLHWKTAYSHPRAKLDPKRKKKITAALKLGYSESELRNAISGYRYSPHHMGKNDRDTVFDDIELFLRDAGHIDKGLQLWETRPRGGGGADINPTDQGPMRGVLT